MLFFTVDLAHISLPLPPSLPPSSGVDQTLQGSYFGAGNMSMTVYSMSCWAHTFYTHTWEYRYNPQTDIADCFGFRDGYYNRIISTCTPYSQHVAGVRCIGEYARVCKCVQEYARERAGGGLMENSMQCAFLHSTLTTCWTCAPASMVDTIGLAWEVRCAEESRKRRQEQGNNYTCQ